ncbi:MAG: 16S rRNA (cytosine(967)-C(5))-methyltransferase RsmB [Selenomonadaceae bacterium]|nr:16S rRNA (cytosine(967)-C(5))-methyltransferase RsmB [Selenomonadaceae bacterium]
MANDRVDKVRNLAVRVLNEVQEEGAYANVALARNLRKAQLTDVDRRFLTELAYGAVKASGTLDWMIRRYVSRPVRKIAPMIRNILRLGFYQIFYMDKVPNSAACNECVELAKKYGHPGTVKFVNAVLRSAVRQPEKCAFPHGKGHATEELALSSFHPQWLVKRWVKALGYDAAAAICAFDNTDAVLSLRTNTLKTTREALLERLRAEGATVEPSAWAPEGILCHAHGALDAMASLQEGLWQVQDESSMQVAHVVAPEPGEFVIDCCSAPGGKTTHLAALMKNEGRIVAGDIYEHKLARIEENAKRLGIQIIDTELLDARDVGHRFHAQADRVLVDAPCSGLGVLRRKPDARWRKREEEIAKLPQLQIDILTSAAEAVRPGGILVYSTCTIERMENEDVVEAFLDTHPEFALEMTGEYLPTKKREENMVQLYPHVDGTDGFFIARMKRNLT